MPRAKSKNQVGLGNSLMNDRFGQGKGRDRRKGDIRRAGHNGESYVTDAPKQDDWYKMRSITQQGALDEFLNTAELAATDFTAEKMSNITVIHPEQGNPFLLSAAEERNVLNKHKVNRKRLTVPRRPPWDSSTSKDQLDRNEKKSLLDWRRGLAELQESNDLLMTPFERNIEVWRQLWRVIERSDLLVQIVDARNPLLFRSADLEQYVKDVNPRKNNLLLVNKADMMTDDQREAWADYFEREGISYTFFSAAIAKEAIEGRLDDEADGEEPADSSTSPGYMHDANGTSADPRTKIITVDELEQLFLKYSPATDRTSGSNEIEVGLVGYPNVGKSSTINCLVGAKKVSVSATPGKTKHFQTLRLSDSITLCDCPGLVFPNFATTKAELVCSGILPIDQLREFTGPTTLVTQRVPQKFLETVYGIKIKTQSADEGGTGIPTAEELLIAYAKARGFAKTGQGQPDESRAARYILKDYVRGKLLFCHPPPADPPIDPNAFNEALYLEEHALSRQDQSFEPADGDDLVEATEELDPESLPAEHTSQLSQGPKARRLESKFLGPKKSSTGHMTMPFNYKYSEQGAAARKELSSRKEKSLVALEKNIDPDSLSVKDKKHYKNRKGAKKPSEDDDDL